MSNVEFSFTRTQSMRSIAYHQCKALHIINAKHCISSMRSVAYHQCKALHIINAKHCISSMRSIAYHQREALHIINAKHCISSMRSIAYHQCEALHIINAKHCISSMRSVAYHQCEALHIINAKRCISSMRSIAYHQREALHIINAKRCISSMRSIAFTHFLYFSQSSPRGHSPHFGALAVQTSLPKVTILWQKSLPSFISIRSRRIYSIFTASLRLSGYIPSLPHILIQCVSQTIAPLPNTSPSRRFAIFRPTPGKSNSSSIVSGRTPPKLSLSITDESLMFAALVL
ncbi:MAG: leucine-rich repeat protein [Clostridia bacterium]|nr:leucine-rich repeat protein [Clostridia bacterium]